MRKKLKRMSFIGWNSACCLQAEVFELSVGKGYDSMDFMRGFMESDTARRLDIHFSRMQAEMPAYIMCALEDEGSGFIHPGVCCSVEGMRWTGYLYRLWHFITGESSKEIYRQADAEAVRGAYAKWRWREGGEVIRSLKEAYTKSQGDTQTWKNAKK